MGREMTNFSLATDDTAVCSPARFKVADGNALTGAARGRDEAERQVQVPSTPVRPGGNYNHVTTSPMTAAATVKCLGMNLTSERACRGK